MNLVQPIRDKGKIARIKALLLAQSPRNHLLFVLGINTGMRIGDMLRLKVSDVQNSHITVKEQKTGKMRRFLVNAHLRELLDGYCKGKPEDEYLFASQKGAGPLSRFQAYRILNDAAREVGLTEIGTHTLRKTFGYWHYAAFKDVAILMQILNHSSPSVTRRYIGVSQDEVDKTIEQFTL